MHRVSETLPSATKILQPKDNHVISFGHFTTASPDFVAKSDHLYNGKQLLEQYAFFHFRTDLHNLNGHTIENHTSLKFSPAVNIRSTGMFPRGILAMEKNDKFTWRLPGRRQVYLTSIILFKDSI
jgi:hypothetical protein